MKRAPAKPDFDHGVTPRAAGDWSSWRIPYIRQAFDAADNGATEAQQNPNSQYWQYGYVKG